jgi:hypothetical protein
MVEPRIPIASNAPPEKVNAFALMRQKLNLAISVLSELEMAISNAEIEAREMQELKALMRKVL